MAGFCGSIQERTIQLFIRSVQIHQKLQNFINDFIWTGFGTVDLVDTYDYMKIQVQSLFQNEFCLRHGSFKSVYQKDHAVYHFQDTFYLAAKIRMSRSINNIDLGAFVMYGCVFGENGDSSFPLDIIGVHDSFPDLLILTEDTALTEKLVYQSGLAVVNVSDDSHVANIFS